MTTIEKNKVIAEFMRLLPNADDYYDGREIRRRIYRNYLALGTYGNMLRFDSSWDWLMPVIQKLYQQADPIFRDSENECRSALCYEPIEEVHKIVYQWIIKINEANNA